jgi:hypothetical protein
MQSVTADYLVGIISRHVNGTICRRRNLPQEYFMPKTINASDEEIVDFILSIPYFDERIKDFIFGNIPETAIIISQLWEIEFMKRCEQWANDKEWLSEENSRKNFTPYTQSSAIFTLPY